MVPLQVRWYQYTHESRMVLLGTGDRGVIISAYQVCQSGKKLIN
jgi:hypothetical protein